MRSSNHYTGSGKKVCVASSRRLVACCSFLITFLVLGFATHSLSAQTFPIQVNTQVTPPYSLKLSDYASATTERIIFNIFADISRPELQVKFRLKIEGQNVTLTTKPEFNPPPITLHGGIPERFSGYDLFEYFNTANLNFQGMTRQQFERTGSLPEGLYRFQLEVLEYNRGVKVSNTGTATAWLILNDPPIINLPRQNEKLKAQSPQNVVLQWTPRHTGSPNAAFTTEYDVSMVEVWPDTRNPNDAILTSPPIFETTTRSTTVIYGPAETPLEPGRRYAFRVRARSIAGIDELDLFKNRGYSEVFTFVYGDACDLPTGIRAESLSSSRFSVSWEGLFNHTAYKVRYREAGKPDASWFTNNSMLTESEVTSLKPNTTYEYQVAGVCGPFEGTYSTVATVKTKEAAPVQYSCGLPMETIEIDPASLVASLNQGDIIQAGDFDVELVRVSGSNGVFSGEGVITVPFFKNAKVKAEFDNILVNKELRMVKGHMNVTGAGVDVVPDEVTEMMNELSETLDEVDKALDKAEETLDKIDDVLNTIDKVLEDVVKYLPDDIVQQINTGRTEMVAAKEKLKQADTPEEKEQAKAEVKAAKQKVKDGVGKAMEYYAKAVARFASIIWKVIVELKQETLGNKPSEEEYLAMKRELELEVYDRQGFSRNVAPADTSSFVFIGSLVEEVDGEPSDPEMKAFGEKAAKFLESKRTQFFIKAMMSFFAFYTSEDAVKDKFIKDASLNGQEIVKTVLTQMKEGKKDDEIKADLKNYIKVTIQDLADHLIAQQ